MPRVLIIQAQMKHYRVPLFTRLFEILQRDKLVSGNAPLASPCVVRDGLGTAPCCVRAMQPSHQKTQRSRAQ